MTEQEEKKKIINRLRTIKGHIQGVEDMIDSGRGCDEVLVQIAAIKQSVHKVGLAVMESHASTCMMESEEMNQQKMQERMHELIKMMFNYSK